MPWWTLALMTACGGSLLDSGTPPDGPADTANPSPEPEPEPEEDVFPVDCFGVGTTGLKSPLSDPSARETLASFDLSVPTLGVAGGELWLLAQMFGDTSATCDTIGLAPLASLPSTVATPLEPLALYGLPALGRPQPSDPFTFPPADPSFVAMPDRDLAVLVTTLRLEAHPQEPCIALAVSRDASDPTAGFDHLEQVLWCEPGRAVMDAAGWYDAPSDTLHLVYSDFSQMNQVANRYALVDVSGAPEAWSILESGALAFQDFHLLGNFSEAEVHCEGPAFYGTGRDATGRHELRTACYTPSTRSFTTRTFRAPDVADPAVATDPMTGVTWLVTTRDLTP